MVKVPKTRFRSPQYVSFSSPKGTWVKKLEGLLKQKFYRPGYFLLPSWWCLDLVESTEDYQKLQH